MLPATAFPDLQRQMLLDLVQRARGGVAVHVVLWSLLGVMGQVVTSSPVLFWSLEAGFIASLLGRLLVEPRLAGWSSTSPKQAQIWFLALLLINPALWGVASAASILLPQLESVSHWLLVVMTGVASGGLLLSIDPLVRRLFAPLTVLPAVVAQVSIATGTQFFPPLAALVFLLYLRRVADVIHRDYWLVVTSQVELEQRARMLEHMSATDALTQVSNRMHFDRQMGIEWSRVQRTTTALTVIMVDIDHFKRINDTYGHPFGDRCLQQVAAALRGVLVRPGDLLARYGGEEFVAMLPATDAAGARAMAAQLHAAVANVQLQHEGQRVNITCSIGVHTVDPPDAGGPAAAIDRADRALYQAKREGRNRVVFFNGMPAVIMENVTTDREPAVAGR